MTQRLQQLIADTTGAVSGICFDGAFRSTHISQFMDTGEQLTAPCPVKKLAKRRNLGIVKAHRWYQEVELFCGGTRLVRIDITDEERRTGLKRAERIHQHAPGSRIYQAKYGFREDSESWNNTIDRTLYGGR